MGHEERATTAAAVEVSVIREPGCIPFSTRMREGCWNFGVAPRDGSGVIAESLRLALRPAMLVLVSGPSGSGKSSVLAALGERLAAVTPAIGRRHNLLWVGRGRFPSNCAIIDAIAPRCAGGLPKALEILT